MKVAELSPPRSTAKAVQTPHFWVITVLMAFGALNYYIDQTPLVGITLLKHSFFTGVHDLHRTLFLIPIIYASLIFRVRGSLITSFAFLGVVLPRALLVSTYPDPLLRPLLFVFFAAMLSLLAAILLNRVESETKARADLNTAYRSLSEYDRQLRESQEQLIQAEKVNSFGQMAASVAHEINNPLSGVLIYTQLLSKQLSSGRFSKEKALDYLSKMEVELSRTTKLIRDLLVFAHQSSPILKEVNLNDVVNRVFALSAKSAGLQHVQVSKELGHSLPKIVADSDQLQQVCTHLIMNAIESMPQGGKLTIRTSTNGNQVKMEVQDTGSGISPENMPRLFTPFFTTKREVKGVGLGLAVSYGIIQRHNGRIKVQSKEGEGSTFAVYLPIPHEESGEKA